MAFLSGEHPGELDHALSRVSPLPDVPPQVPVGLPSDLLRRRPDIRAAERRWAAATARVGAAQADLFPRFNLTGALGVDSTEAKNLFEWPSRYFAVNPAVSWPLLDWGRIRSRVKVQDARREQAWLAYENSVDRALKDVEDALVDFQSEQVRRGALADAVENSRRALTLAQQRYGHGLVDFLTVLQAQQSLLMEQDALVQSDGAIRTSLVALYKALGGGWE